MEVPTWYDLDPLKCFEGIRTKEELSSLPLERISIRLHTMAIQVKGGSANLFEGSSACARLSFQPLPGRVSQLRSLGAILQEDDSALFNFGKKTAVLGMSAVDLRSRLFREGYVARTHLVVTVAQYEFFSYVFLPALVDACLTSNDRIFTLPLITAGVGPDEAPLSANIVVEVSPTAESGFVSDNLPPVDLENQLMLAHIFKLKGSKVKGEYMHSPEPVTVTTTIRGLINFEFEAANMPMVRLEAGMSSSGKKVSVDIHKYATKPWWVRGREGKAYKKARGLLKTKGLSSGSEVPGFTMQGDDGKNSITLLSQHPELDCLFFRLYTGPSVEEEIGQVSIPVRSLLARENCDPGLKEIFMSHVTNGDGQRNIMGEWSICLEGTCVSTGKTAPNCLPATAADVVESKMLVKAEEVLEEKIQSGAHQAPVAKMGWMNSTVEEGDGPIYQVAPNTTMNVRRAPAVNGSLTGCVFGFVCQSKAIPTGVTALSSNHFKVAISMQPEGLKKESNPQP